MRILCVALEAFPLRGRWRIAPDEVSDDWKYMPLSYAAYTTSSVICDDSFPSRGSPIIQYIYVLPDYTLLSFVFQRYRAVIIPLNWNDIITDVELIFHIIC